MALAPSFTPSLAWSEGRAPTVIMVSLDGTRPQDVDAETLPSLHARRGLAALADRLVPSHPANTFPNHVTLVTGVVPEKHGLVDNRFRDPERGDFQRRDIQTFIEVPPLWSLLESAGIPTAAYHWVGSEGQWPGGHAPRHWVPFDPETEEQVKVDQMLAWLDLPDAEGRPRLLTSWFHGADHAGHVYGPGTEQARAQLKAQDGAMSALLAGLDARGLFGSTTLIVLSDHGMVAPEEKVDLGRLLKDAGIGARAYGIGGFASVYLDEDFRGDRDAALDRIVALARAQGLEAHRREAAPSHLGVAHRRYGEVVVFAEPETAIVYEGLEIAGFHGYDPEHPTMAAFFMALGRGVEGGTRLGTIRNVDVAPTVLALLGQPIPGHMQGRPIAAILPASPSPSTSATLPPHE